MRRRRLKVGREMAAASWRFFRAEPGLRAVAFGACLAMIGFSVLSFSMIALAMGGGSNAINPLILFAATGLGSAFIGTFLGATVVAFVSARLDGAPMTWQQAAEVAWRVRRRLLAWSLFQVSVGWLLRFLSERLPFGWLVELVAGVAWSLGTVLVLPVLLEEERRPLGALRRSAELLRPVLGPTVVGLTTAAFLPTVFGVAIGAAVVLPILAIGGGPEMLAATMFAMVLVVFATMSVVTCVTHVFQVVLYRYATTGRTPAAFDGIPMFRTSPPTSEFGAWRNQS